MKASLKPKLTVSVRSAELKNGSYVSKETGKVETYTSFVLGCEVADGNDASQLRVSVSMRDDPTNPPAISRGDTLELALDAYQVEKGAISARVARDGIKVLTRQGPAAPVAK